ncbi:hypothetical protein GUJ93_ZPchr0002g23565 [Zizania palustris]|uniref:TPR repeat-containing thioredoxin TDX n=1 Tax=Zizania palustris TaxID=103762 RepID=A0A8J5RZ10_ZIZPA|nr:hypothetical protein GUJ93_ZPchr0002g23565 [Zizania palustris]
MERDFLGAIGKEQQHQQPRAEERKESAYFGGGGGGGAPAMDWSFASRAAGAPALMSFRSAATEERREHAFPQFSAFDGAKKQASHVLKTQKSFGADSHGMPQYAAAVHGAHRGQPPHVLNGARVIPASLPFNSSSQMFRIQSSPLLPTVAAAGGGGAFKQPPFAMAPMSSAAAGSTVGVYGSRDVPKAKTAQLTIFYAGSVNVFNNISPEKAQEIMFLASRGSLPNSPGTVARMPEAPGFAPAKASVPEVSPTNPMLLQKPQLVSPPVSAISNPKSIVSQPASLPRSASSSNIDSTAPNSSRPLAVPPTSLQPASTQPDTLLATTTAAAIMPRAVPQARKASLARFLEKRKERVTTVAPYPSAKSPVESSDTIGSGNDNKSSCTDIALSSNHDESLSLSSRFSDHHTGPVIAGFYSGVTHLFFYSPERTGRRRRRRAAAELEPAGRPCNLTADMAMAGESSFEDEIMESDIELDGEVVEADNDPPQKMGDPSVEISDEKRDQAQLCKMKGIDALSEGKLDEAIEHLTEAVILNPTSAIVYATRAGVFVKAKKPSAAVRDADAALKINPDSAKGYKSRGMAKAMLGKWEDAARDLRMAAQLDYDEEIGTELKKVEPNVHKIEEHRKKYERLRIERDMKKADMEKQRKHAEEISAASAALKDGDVIAIHSSSELETKLKAASSLSRLVVLYFTAGWCGPCRFIGPVYQSLAEKHRNVVFLKVDIDELNSVAHRWNVSSVPSFFFLRNGKEIDKVVGADKNGLERKLAQHGSS